MQNQHKKSNKKLQIDQQNIQLKKQKPLETKTQFPKIITWNELYLRPKPFKFLMSKIGTDNENSNQKLDKVLELIQKGKLAANVSKAKQYKFSRLPNYSSQSTQQRIQSLVHHRPNTRSVKTFSKKMLETNSKDIHNFDRYQKLLDAFQPDIKCSKLKPSRTLSRQSPEKEKEYIVKELEKRRQQNIYRMRSQSIPMTLQNIKARIVKERNKIKSPVPLEYKMVASKQEVLNMLKGYMCEQQKNSKDEAVQQQQLWQRQQEQRNQSLKFKSSFTPSDQQFWMNGNVSRSQSLSPFRTLYRPIWQHNALAQKAPNNGYQANTRRTQEMRIPIPVKEYINTDF